MKNKYILILILGVAILAIVFIATNFWDFADKKEPIVTNFEECVSAGNPVMESHPRQCRHGDETFTETIYCAQDVMLCPDGETYVGRTGPSCEFTPCPSELTEDEREAKGNSDTNEEEDASETNDEIKASVSAYIKANISDLSTEPEVLGGTFYVTNITFTSDSSGVVEYEDGHIALVADFTFTISQEGDIEVELTNTREAEE